MNSELMAFAIPAICIFIGFVIGRMERKDSYIKGYQRGKEIGISVGRVEISNEIALKEYKELMAKRAGNDR